MIEPKRIRVLHIITRMILGGAQEHALLTVEGLNALPEYEVELITGVDRGREGELLTRAVETTKVSVVRQMERRIDPIADLIALWKLQKLVRNGRFHIVHTHSWKAGVLGRMAAWLAGTPVIVHTFHGLTFHEHQPWLINRLICLSEKISSLYTHHFLSVSDITTKKALAANIGSPDRYTTVYTGMELDWYLNSKADPLEVRRGLGIDGDALVVGKIARLAPQKNHDELLKAVPEIVRRHPGVRFLLVGDGPLHDEFLDKVRRLGVEENFVFAGLVDRERVPEMISAMDVVAHTALWEGLPRVLPQAMAMGKPCVAFNTEGTPEVLIQDETGYVVERHDSAGLAEIVSRLLSDKKLRERIGAAARKHVDPKFRSETMVAGTADVYGRLLAERRKEVLRFEDHQRLGGSEPVHQSS
jgi:glycosyltransferase involved in cell wall biosynthesis